MSPHPRTLADLGEDAFLARVFEILTPGSQTLLGVGDDAAVVRAPDGRVVLTTDTLVQDVDFRLDWSTASDVGHKAAAQNLADVAAMGAVPTGYLVTLVAPADTPVQWGLEVTRGIVDACVGFGAAAVGGDLSGGPTLMVSLTMVGDLEGRRPVRRSGARPGDVVALAGEVGWSSAGLDVLRRGLVSAGSVRPGSVRPGPGPADVPSDYLALAERALLAHRRPRPPISLGPVAARAGAHAMIDTSDGLVRDASRLARSSGVRLTLSPEDDGLTKTLAQLSLLAQGLGEPAEYAARWLLGGGEDHALLATFAAETELPPGFTVVGRVTDAGMPSTDEASRVTVEGAYPAGVGFDHFNRGAGAG